eukprot:5125961-Pleurochrysis_carterae.AAC.3
MERLLSWLLASLHARAKRYEPVRWVASQSQCSVAMRGFSSQLRIMDACLVSKTVHDHAMVVLSTDAVACGVSQSDL